MVGLGRTETEMTPGKVTIEHGSLSFQMTAQDLITQAVNVVQNHPGRLRRRSRRIETVPSKGWI